MNYMAAHADGNSWREACQRTLLHILCVEIHLSTNNYLDPKLVRVRRFGASCNEALMAIKLRLPESNKTKHLEGTKKILKGF